jgi:hypothetical protein
MNWILLGLLGVAAAWLYGAKQVATNAPPIAPPTIPVAKDGRPINVGSVVQVSVAGIHDELVISQSTPLTDFLTTKNVPLTDNVGMQVDNLQSVKGPNFIVAHFDDPRIGAVIPTVPVNNVTLDIPVSAVVSVT